MNIIELLSPSGTKEINITESNSENIVKITDIFNISDENSLESTENKKFDLVINLDKNCNNSNITVIARYETVQKQKKYFTISVFLHGKNQTAKIDLRGVSDDSSLLTFNGGGILTENSEKSKIEIIQRIHLFSEKSKAKAIPILRVETDDVLSASHSASVAPFSNELYFFMETRGITRKDAKELMKKGLLL